jgi:hypothetical protein
MNSVNVCLGSDDSKSQFIFGSQQMYIWCHNDREIKNGTNGCVLSFGLVRPVCYQPLYLCSSHIYGP